MFFGSSKKAIIFAIAFGRVAQLVQSTCLTSRGSEVRLLSRPQKPRLLNSLGFLLYSFLFFYLLNIFYILEKNNFQP